MATFKKTGPFSFTAEREDEMKVPAEVIASDTLMQSLKESKNEGSLKQLLNVAMMPGIIWKALAMPDIHQGYGFPIGGVAAFDAEEGLVSPGGVGYDINCGIMLLKTDLTYNEVKPKITEIVDRLFSSVPTGNNKSGMKLNGTSVIEEIAREGCVWAEEKRLLYFGRQEQDGRRRLTFCELFKPAFGKRKIKGCESAIIHRRWKPFHRGSEGRSHIRPTKV
jgi:Uncharacterized conserved protein, COG1690